MDLENIIRVGYDLDGTLANFIRGWTGQAHRMFRDVDQIVNDKELDEYDLHKKYGKRANAVWNAIERKPGFYESLKPYKQAVKDTKQLINNKEVEPHYITARADATLKNYFGQFNKHQEKRERRKIRRQTEDWLQQYGLRGQLHMRSDKGRAARDLGLDFYVDNRVEATMDVQRKSSTRGYLLDKAYNRDGNVRQRVDSVQEYNNEVRELIDKL